MGRHVYFRTTDRYVEFRDRHEVRMDNERKRQRQLLEEWKHPEGTRCVVRLDDGTERATVTRSRAWMLGASSSHEGHTAVVLLDGISGAYMLSRVRLAG
jgi:hypothetical protein